MSSKGWIGKLWLANYTVNARVPFAEDFIDHLARSAWTSLEFQDATLQEKLLGNVAASFVHGGIHPLWATKPYAVHYINDLGKSLLSKATDSILPSPVSLPKNTTPEEAALYAADGKFPIMTVRKQSLPSIRTPLVSRIRPRF